ncbi:MAG: gamma-glutamyl-gamma-aminobutyrate hydrolase family protein, partial [Candidatus Riflebacteria bacterium]|nr:gamma-glutamyl-gamma-aminobutyrate hydrolase family protein [Candidatus Riflebacteria bacterium]
ISRHHQAIEKVAKPFVVVARGSDGVVEAIERHNGAFGLFVQWHPESMKDADPNHRNRLFKAFIDASLMVRSAR